MQNNVYYIYYKIAKYKNNIYYKKIIQINRFCIIY